MQLEKELQQLKRLCEIYDKKQKAAEAGFKEADAAQLKFRFALKILGCTDEELDKYLQTEDGELEEKYNNLFGEWRMNERIKAYFDDIKKYGIEEADRRDEFRAKAITFLGHGMTREELINEWEKH